MKDGNMTEEPYPLPRFSLAERDRRWALVRKSMAEKGIDVIVTPQNTGHSMDFQADSRYLTHVGGGGDADIAAVFPLEGEVTAIATSAVPRWTARIQDWTADVREARRDYGKQIVARIRELGLKRPRIGITGLGEIGGTRSPEGLIIHGTWQRIRDGFPDSDIVDATDVLQAIRDIKSEEEIACLTKSVQIIEKGYEAEIAAARAGAVDWEVWAATQYGLLRHGSEAPIHCNWISGPNAVRTLTRPTFRVLERGDLIINELEACWIGYQAQGVQPVFVEEASEVHKELIKIQREVFNEVLAATKPGTTLGLLSQVAEKAVAKMAPKTGVAAGATARLTMHGKGAGDDGPIITSSARDTRHLNYVLKENMTFTFKPGVSTADGASICVWGDTVVITAKGGRRLGTRPHDLAVSG
ncbi:MAG TPA: M24 family metallopeptidase [Alphaproteobacteria bacterium]|jgi:Xaa-Pro aminopeptidase